MRIRTYERQGRKVLTDILKNEKTMTKWSWFVAVISFCGVVPAHWPGAIY